MAKPYKEGKGWAIRFRVRGQDIYRSGFAAAKDATKAAERERAHIEDIGKPAHRGPHRTTVAQAFLDYALQKLPYLKGAAQDSSRINAFLRAAGQDTIKVRALSNKEREQAKAKNLYAEVTVVQYDSGQKIVPSLLGHRLTQSLQRAKTDLHRQRLADTKMADVEPEQLQRLVDAMIGDGYSPATITLSMAEIKRLFSHAAKKWSWAVPFKNPACAVELPAVDNQRDRVLTRPEWVRLCAALDECRNPFVAPAIALLLETAMRSSEPLVHATWSDVIWERAVLCLQDAKAGKREVPLTPDAMKVLKALHARKTDERILPISYEAFKASWKRACERAKIEGLNPHDLRHTAATRSALEFHGNKFVLKAITGHKTDSQLERYVNIKADDVVELMHGRRLTDNAPARLSDAIPKSLGISPTVESEENDALGTNVIRGNFGKRRAA